MSKIQATKESELEKNLKNIFANYGVYLPDAMKNDILELVIEDRRTPLELSRLKHPNRIHKTDLSRYQDE